MFRYNGQLQQLVPQNSFLKQGTLVAGLPVTYPIVVGGKSHNETFIHVKNLVPSPRPLNVLIRFDDVRPVRAEVYSNAEGIKMGNIAVPAITGAAVGGALGFAISSMAGANKVVVTSAGAVLGGLIGASMSKPVEPTSSTSTQKPSPTAAADDGDYSNIITGGYYCCKHLGIVNGHSCYTEGNKCKCYDGAGNWITYGSAKVCAASDKGGAIMAGRKGKSVKTRRAWW